MGSTGDMVSVPGGTFAMGSEAFYAEEAPVHRVTVDAFQIDRHPVTVREFRRFVRETGYVTVAERPLDPADYPGADPSLLKPGSLVFQKAPHRVSLRDHTRWWAYVPGASWTAPRGPGTTIAGLDRHPVTHVAYEDAAGYAAWAGKALPTEAEWEYAAGGGDTEREFPWGPDFRGDHANTVEEGPLTTTPVGIYPAGRSVFGADDMAGNVEEFVADDYTAYPGGDEVADDLTTGGSYRVARGGSFTRFGDLARCARRHGWFDRRIYAIGFRLAEETTEGEEGAL
jgi:formylglycine-generating enzyme required for sulfatase activity